MLRVSTFVLAMAAAIGSGVANPAYGLFDYQKPTPPVAGNCAEIAAAIGPEATWHGEFSGNRYDNTTDHYFPFGASGCFESELACRVWQNDAITYIGQGQIYYTRCRRGG
jgi:hypothetical protein